LTDTYGDTLGWGILGTGRIARSFATDLREVPGARLAAIGSRTPGSAQAFATAYGGDDCTPHASYEALVADPAVDVVYVATPHTRHLEDSRLAFEAGKHVLCEKPLAVNAAEADEMVRLAGEHDRFLMEGMWMACNPVVRAVLDQERFGRPRQVHADLGWVVETSPHDRLVDPALGGGALLDMGVYVLTLAHLVLGEAAELRAVADVNEAGIDLDVAIAGRYADGATAALTASMTSLSPRAATIATDRGLLTLPSPFHHPGFATWTSREGTSEQITGVEPLIGTGLGNEAAEVMRCLREGLRESPLVPLAQSQTVMRQMDDIRSQIGVRYDADRSAEPTG
jgi:predicted dehydrogenase